MHSHRSAPATVLLCSLLGAVHLGCGGDAGTSGVFPTSPQRSTTPARTLELEESELYRLDGTTLFVQNRTTGLNVVDVADPARPQQLGVAPVSGGVGSEIYVRPERQVVVLLATRSTECHPLPGLTREGLDLAGDAQGAELALVDARDRSSPEIVGRYCLPSKLSASRMIGAVLYLVLDAGQSSRGQLVSLVLSLDLADLRAPRLIAQKEIEGAADEIHLAETTLAVAGDSGALSTKLTFFDVGGDGRLRRASEITVPGSPAGRFHMELRGTQFRIVTRGASASNLSVIDLSERAAPKLVGMLTGIGADETLYATRFEADRAYVVTFPTVIRVDSRDPLWVIDLKQPTQPTILGELIVPGWSEFLFPRGDRLVAVGRAADTVSFGVTLFDVSDPRDPRTLHQYNIGGLSSSEAQVDHRGVTILERMGDSAVPAIIVPYAEVTRSSKDRRTTCGVRNHLQIIDLERDRLPTRGVVDLKGTARRSFLVGDLLYGLSDYEVKAIDVSDRDAPVELAQLTVSDEATLRTTTEEICSGETGNRWFGGGAGCSMAGRQRDSVWTALCAAAAMLLLSLRRRRRRVIPLGVVAILLLGISPAQAQSPCDPDELDCVRAVEAPAIPAPPPATLPAQLGDEERPAPVVLERWRPRLFENPRPVVVETRRVGLGVAGINVFAATWLATAGAGYITGENLLSIPLFGPLVYLGKYRERFDCDNSNPEILVTCARENQGDRMLYGALALDTLVQAGGLVMAGLGFGLKKQTTTISFVPQTSMQRVGLVVAGTF